MVNFLGIPTFWILMIQRVRCADDLAHFASPGSIGSSFGQFIKLKQAAKRLWQAMKTLWGSGKGWRNGWKNNRKTNRRRRIRGAWPAYSATRWLSRGSHSIISSPNRWRCSFLCCCFLPPESDWLFFSDFKTYFFYLLTAWFFSPSFCSIYFAKQQRKKAMQKANQIMWQVSNEPQKVSRPTTGPCQPTSPATHREPIDSRLAFCVAYKC